MSSPRCIHEGCKLRAAFNNEGEKKGLYCFAHKELWMVNVVSRKCIYSGCKVQPIYGVKGSKKAIFCALHKERDMVDVVNKRCIHPGCDTKPYFNIKGSKKAIFCTLHKESDMVDVINKRCIHPGCETLSTFSIKNKKERLFCAKHKTIDMVYNTSRICMYEDCKIKPSFNTKDKKTAIYCFSHRQVNMVNVVSKTCIYEGCKTLPIFNTKDKKTAIYCSSHRLEFMIDIKHKRCNSGWCLIKGNKKYEGYCLFCFINTFPDKPTARNYKTKEVATVDFVKQNYPKFDWTTDKKIQGGCSRRRPDMMLDLGHQVIIVEVDENQHINYDCSCENKRIMELSKDVDHRPVIFIRFNPDDYKVGDETIKSCWGVNKQGICTVKKSKKEEWEARLEALRAQIEYWSNPDNTTIKTVEVIELFYDK